MNIYCILDTTCKKVLDTFTGENDAVARMKMAQALYTCRIPIGLDTRILQRIGSINMENANIIPESPATLCNLKVLFDDNMKVMKQYEQGK